MTSILAFTNLLANSADNIVEKNYFFPRKKGFDISCRLSETICIKCQNLLFGKNKKIIFTISSADFFFFFFFYPACKALDKTPTKPFPLQMQEGEWFSVQLIYC